jgi:hypothetical protein
MKVNKTFNPQGYPKNYPPPENTLAPESLSSLNLAYEKADCHYSLVQPSLDPTKDKIGGLPPIKEVPACLFAASEFDSRHFSVSSAVSFLKSHG